MLASEDYGKDLASVQNLLKKQQLLEADITAHEVGFTSPHKRVLVSNKPYFETPCLIPIG